MDGVASVLLYIFVFAVSAVTVQYGYKHKSVALQLVGLLLPILLGGLRYNVGLDYFSYLDAYADIVNPQTFDRYVGTPSLEFSFHLIVHVSNFFFSTPIAVYFIYAAVTVFAFYRALSLMKPSSVSAALFFFYSIFFLNSFNTMRQGAAVSLGCLAMVDYMKGNRFKAAIYSLLAIAFHLSALLLIPYMLAGRWLDKRYIAKKKKKKFSSIFMVTSIISAGLAAAGLTVVAFGNFIYSATGRIGEFSSNISAGVIFKYLLCIACLYLVVYAWKNFDTIQKRLSLFVALGTVVYALGLVHNEAARLGMYLIALVPVLFAVTYDSLKLRKAKNMILTNGALILLCSAYIVGVHVESGNGVKYDYQSVIMSESYRQRIKELNI